MKCYLTVTGREILLGREPKSRSMSPPARFYYGAFLPCTFASPLYYDPTHIPSAALHIDHAVPCSALFARSSSCCMRFLETLFTLFRLLYIYCMSGTNKLDACLQWCWPMSIDRSRVDAKEGTF